MIGTMNILAACGGPDSPVRKVVFKSSAHYYGCERDDPAFFTERMQRPHPPRTRLESDIVEAEKAVARLRRAQPGRHGDHAALLQRPRARPAGPPHRAVLAAGGPVHPRLRPALPVHPRGRHRRRAASTPCATTCRASTTPPATACSRCRRSRACSASRWPRSCRRGAPALALRALRPLGVRVPPEVLNQLRYGRGLDNRKLKAARATASRFTTRETVQAFAEALRVAAGQREMALRRTATSARSRNSCATAPRCVGKRH